MSIHVPSLNAILNGTCALLLIAGLVAVKKGAVGIHRAVMGCALLVSVVFLISYLVYHAHHGATKFLGQGWIRPVYFAILVSHTILATVIVPLVLRTLYLAVRNRFEEHKRIARWTFPLWLYVSVTGVIVYWMLYRMDWWT
ncbi:MAG: DUF420 domain-containing protein [Candidatus Omnitrophica bacterium]|nr:DUF420 domain-containing protein [Candidatus Omnitrophota bacterium]